MAVNFNLKKYEQIKADYLEYLETGSTNASSLRMFDVYKMYLEVDEDVKSYRAKQAANKKQKQEIIPVQSSNKLFVHPRIASIYEQWKERVDQLTQDILQRGISKKRYKSLLKELDSAILDGEQRRRFVKQIDVAKNEYIARENLRVHNERIAKEDFFCIAFRVKGRGFITIDHNSILSYLNDNTLDKLNSPQRHQLLNAIELCAREFPDVPKIQHIQELYEKYYSGKRERKRIKLRSREENKTLPDSDNIEPIIPKDDLPDRVTVSWADIRFYQNKIRIGTPIFNKPIIVEKKCRSSYNKIKELLSEKLPEIVIRRASDSNYRLIKEIELDNAIALIQKKEAEDLFNDDIHYRAKLSFNKTWSIAEEKQELLLKKLYERKQSYINYLISLHKKLSYKIVPAVEIITHESSESVIEEDAFIFTIPSSHDGCVIIVYENVNIARASILFVVQKEKYMDSLQRIFNYMGDDRINNKREYLRKQPSINAEGVLHIYSINHVENMHEWVMKLKK